MKKKQQIQPFFSLNARIQNQSFIKSDVINKNHEKKKKILIAVGYEKKATSTSVCQTNREKKH